MKSLVGEGIPENAAEDSATNSSRWHTTPVNCRALPWTNVVLCAIILCVVVLLALPLMVFYLPRDDQRSVRTRIQCLEVCTTYKRPTVRVKMRYSNRRRTLVLLMYIVSKRRLVKVRLQLDCSVVSLADVTAIGYL